MRLLAIADIHGAVGRIAELDAEIEAADLVLIAGDLTDFGGADEAREIVEKLTRSAKRILLVPGNCDRKGAREFLASSGLSIDGSSVEVDGLRIAGCGGGLVRSGLTPYERHEAELETSLEHALLSEGEGSKRAAPIAVLSHTPPRASGADSRKGSLLGSRALRGLLDRFEPILWVCGHIHESRSARLVGRTLVLNPGPLTDGNFARVSLLRDGSGVLVAKAELLP